MDSQTAGSVIAGHAYARFIRGQTPDPLAGSRRTSSSAERIEWVQGGDEYVFTAPAVIGLIDPLFVANLYPDGLSEGVRAAINLAIEATELIGAGSAALANGERIEAAGEFLEACASLYSAIGSSADLEDGATLLLSSCANAIRNAGFIDLDSGQCQVLQRVLATWSRAEPFANFDRASELVDLVAAANLNVSPPAFEAIVEMLTPGSDDGSIS